LPTFLRMLKFAAFSSPLVRRIHVVDPGLGKVVQRLPEKIIDGGIPLDGPASVAFRGTELLITNHALFTDNPDRWAILALDVGQQGLPLFYPAPLGQVSTRAILSRHQKR
jgi:hypothetical protein